MRAFIGVEITDEVRAALSRAQQQLGRCPAKVKWVAPENIHVMLKFLGDIDEETAARVRAAMAEASGDGGFRFAVAGLGCFPPRGKPRVVWAGVSEGADAATRLQAKLERALRPLGFEKERRFVPHLTIGRVKSPKGAEELLPMIEELGGETFGSCDAAEMVMFESTLTPRGAIYHELIRQKL